MKLQSKAILYIAIGGLLAMMGGMIVWATMGEAEMERAQVEVVKVELVDVNTIENFAKLKLTFKIYNPSSTALTISHIDYEIFADEKSLGMGSYNTQDIPMTGRASIFSHSETELQSLMKVSWSEEIDKEYQAIISGKDVIYKTKGQGEFESAWSIIEFEFDNTLD